MLWYAAVTAALRLATFCIYCFLGVKEWTTSNGGQERKPTMGVCILHMPACIIQRRDVLSLTQNNYHAGENHT